MVSGISAPNVPAGPAARSNAQQPAKLLGSIAERGPHVANAAQTANVEQSLLIRKAGRVRSTTTYDKTRN